MTEFNIAVPILKSIEKSLLINGRAYVKELAKILKVDERELVKRVLPSADVVQLHIYNTTDIQCTAFIMCNDVIARCKNPIFNGKHFCSEHLFERNEIIENRDTVVVRKIIDLQDKSSLWIKNDTVVIDSFGNQHGIWSRDDGKLTLITIV